MHMQARRAKTYGRAEGEGLAGAGPPRQALPAVVTMTWRFAASRVGFVRGYDSYGRGKERDPFTRDMTLAQLVFDVRLAWRLGSSLPALGKRASSSYDSAALRRFGSWRFWCIVPAHLGPLDARSGYDLYRAARY